MRGAAVPSSVLMAPITQRFVNAINRYAERNGIDVVSFRRGERKDDRTQEYLRNWSGGEGVLYIGKAQEKARVLRTERRHDPATGATYAWLVSSTAMVNHFYFYAVDDDFGPFFLKFCSYFPYNAKLCINGHEYLKRQLTKRGIAFEPLDNGILSCSDPEAMQRLADGLTADKIDALLRKWLARLPHPFSANDRKQGIRYDISMLQAEFARTEVFDLMHPLILPASDHSENLAIHPLFHEHVSERLHQRTNPILGPIGEMVVQHQPLPKQRMRPPLHRVRLQPAVITDALARRTQQRQHGDRQRTDQQQAVPSVRARNMHRRKPHPEAHVLDVPKARLNPPALAVVPNQDPRRDLRFAGHQAPRFVHLRILYAHDRADRQLVRVGHPSTHQPPRTPPGADPRGGRSPLAPRTRHVDVSTQPNHVFEGQLRRQRGMSRTLLNLS